MKIAVVFNMKGGIGKTTTAVLLAESAAFYCGHRVLLVDADAQMNASRRLCLPKRIQTCQVAGKERNLSKYLKEAVTKSKLPDPRNYIEKRVGTVHGSGQVDMMVGASDTHNTDRLIAGKIAEQRAATHSVFSTLASAFKNLGEVGKYDLVVVDCPPTLTTIAQGAVSSADILIVPMVGDKASTIQFDHARERIAHELKCTGFKMPAEEIVFGRYKASDRSIFANLVQRFTADLKVNERNQFKNAELFYLEQGNTISNKYGSAAQKQLKELANKISVRLGLPLLASGAVVKGVKAKKPKTPKETLNVGKRRGNSRVASRRANGNSERKASIGEAVSGRD